MSVETDLGWFQLSYQKAGLQLTLTATAKASGPLPVKTDVSSNQSEATLVDDQSSWVSRGNNFCVVLDISASDQGLVSILREQDFLPSFGEILSKSELFRQLNLRPQVSIHPHSTSEPNSARALGSITLCISHDRNFIDSKKPHHRLLKQVPCADLRPPKRIDSLELKEVRLSACLGILQKNGPRKKSRNEPKPHSQSIDAASTNRDLFRDQNSYLQNDDLLDETDNQQDVPLLDTSCSADSLGLGHGQTEDFEMLDDLSAALQPASPHTHVRGTVTNQGVYQKELLQHPPKLLSDRLLFGMTDISMQLTHAIDLIDAAVRMTICKKPIKLARGIKTTAENFPSRLSDIAPTIFSPGYLSALAERAIFIPTISRALTTRISTNATSASLQAKLARLGVGDPGNGLGPELRGAASVDHNEAATDKALHNAAVKTRIWRMAQGTLRSPAAERRLKPIRTPDLQIDSSSVGKDDILESVVTPCWKREPEMLDDDDDDEMLTGEEDDEILEGWEETQDDILEDVSFAPLLGQHRDPQSEWELPVNSFNPSSMDEDILVPPLQLLSSKPDFVHLNPAVIRDGIYEEMLA